MDGWRRENGIGERRAEGARGLKKRRACSSVRGEETEIGRGALAGTTTACEEPTTLADD